MRTSRGSQRVRLLVYAAFAATLLVGCGSDDDGGGGGNNTPTPTPTPTAVPGIEDVLSDFRTADGMQAVLMSGSPPQASGGPTIMAPVSVTVPDATTQPLVVTSDEGIDMLTLAVPGTDGYWVLDFGNIGPGFGGGAGTLPTSVDLLVGFATDPPLRNFDCLFAASNAGGAVGDDAVTSVSIDTCTVGEFCAGSCDAAEAAACLTFCEDVDLLPDCALDINAPAACEAVLACLDTSDCNSAGQCAESATDGIVGAECATETCEAVQ